MQFKYPSFNRVLLPQMAGWAYFEMCSWSVWAVTFNMPLGQSAALCLKAGLGFSLASLPRTASPIVNHSTRQSLCFLTHWHSYHGNQNPSRRSCQEQEFSEIWKTSLWSSVHAWGLCSEPRLVLVTWLMHLSPNSEPNPYNKIKIPLIKLPKV